MVDFNRTNAMNRPRRRAISTLIICLVSWVAFSQSRDWWFHETFTPSDHAPQLIVDLKNASEDELRLLPNIGEKSARLWREKIRSSAIEVPRTAKELEQLPRVGPIRASKLAPYLVDKQENNLNALNDSFDPGNHVTNSSK